MKDITYVDGGDRVLELFNPVRESQENFTLLANKFAHVMF